MKEIIEANQLEVGDKFEICTEIEGYSHHLNGKYRVIAITRIIRNPMLSLPPFTPNELRICIPPLHCVQTGFSEVSLPGPTLVEVERASL